MKKAITAVLAAAMILSVTSCQEPTDPSNTEETPTEPVTETTVEPTETTPAPSLPKSNDPIALPGKSEYLYESNLPEDIRYLDDTRDLKDNYTLDEAFEKYAIRLHYSTLIVTHNDEYDKAHSFYCCDYKKNQYYCANLFGFGDGLEEFEVLLEDTKCTTLSEFKNDFLALKPITELETKLVTTRESTILEETDDYVIGMIPYNNNTNEYTGVNYYYYFAKIIGSRVYVIRCMKGQKTLDESQISLLKEKCLTVFDDLHEDDGKEPYIYDKALNISIFGDKHIRSFDSIGLITPTYIDLRGNENARVFINPSDYLIELLDSEWTQAGDMKIQVKPYYSTLFWFAIDDVEYLVMAFIDADSSEDLIKQLTEAGLII